ncbi:cysteine protease StiP family protein [Thorsellia anophelis]|uniref:PELOTA RNA binding domain-containing protein n=1 Tax=Thorsellia anophelis DSM 18579 TaxID=1123402 RepID=A0A1I0EN86_9GAMM|nr:cysteine protease StiP family protein [Thorsellia anophelis]SET46916.1 PELOTA RNA binding domain-containing protein [Thorsellia anophelis DSM 18579]
MTFSGIYPQHDITFLLEPIEMEMTSIEEKERLIQSGEKHYSQMLSQEPEPSLDHLGIYENALKQYEHRLAKEVMQLAITLKLLYKDKPIVLLSLVRAGVPLGVLLTRALKLLKHEVFHYGISIIRDKGIDSFAMNYVESIHEKHSIIFVDGWTGKGAISQQLKLSLDERGGYPSIPRLVVLADVYGSAWLSASNEDWLIPFGILGAPISGLVSRSIWQENSFHGCVFCTHLSAFSCSNEFIETVERHFHLYIKQASLIDINDSSMLLNGLANQSSRTECENVIFRLKKMYQVDKINRIKPGIAEATRAVLRRVPDHVIVRDKTDPDVSLLLHLAKQKNIIVTEMQDAISPYRAITIIKRVN